MYCRRCIQRYEAIKIEHHAQIMTWTSASFIPCLIDIRREVTCFPIYKSSNNSHVNIQHSRLLDWSEHVSLPLNISKCKSLLISSVNDCKGVDLLQVDNVANVKRLKLLDVTFNSKCSWNNHIDNIVLNASRRLFPLRFIRQHVNRSQLKTLYYSFVRSLFDYCAPFLLECQRNVLESLIAFNVVFIV